MLYFYKHGNGVRKTIAGAVDARTEANVQAA